jgi:hypothetical protein
MSAKESFVEKLQIQFKEQLQKLKEEQEILKEQHKFANILPLQSRSPKRGPPFPSPVYYSFFFSDILFNIQV